MSEKMTMCEWVDKDGNPCYWAVDGYCLHPLVLSGYKQCKDGVVE